MSHRRCKIIKGIDSNKDVFPILTDSSGRVYVIIHGTIEIIQDTAADLNATVTQAAKDRTITDLKPDGTNTLPAMDVAARAGYQRLTDGSESAKIELDDDGLPQGSKHLVVINLNYVWDTDTWVRMTQP